MLIDKFNEMEQRQELHLCGTGNPEYQNIDGNTNNAEINEKESSASIGKLTKSLIRRINIRVFLTTFYLSLLLC